MTGQNPDQRFPTLEDPRRLDLARELAAIAVQSSQLVDDFAAVERIPRYADGHRENDVEHSYMLAIAAAEMALVVDLDLDVDKVRRFGLSHDLLELKVGDVATFNLTPAQLLEKERLEQAAKQELKNELPKQTAEDLEEYERQDTKEAVFVRMVDKLLPVAVDITGDGVRIMREDYGVTDHDELVKSHAELHARVAEKFHEFPDLVATHAVLCQMFEEKYLESLSSNKVAEKPRNPTEIERKFLIDLDKLPESIDLSRVNRAHLKQGYLAVGADGSETRVRSFDDERFELTVKSAGMIARDEQPIKLTREMFESLWQQTAGRRVAKTRYYIPLGDNEIELDIYEGHLEGVVTAEVEFHGRSTEAMVRATTFEPPEWFGKDVSEDGRYKNHNLAKKRPHDPIRLGAKQF